jgi:hypothetical protein
MICGALLRLGVAERDLMSAEESAVQTEWLVESGMERAAAKLRASAGYGGETWNVSADELNGRSGGTVTIAVDPDSSNRHGRLVTIVADYPSTGARRNRQRKRVAIVLDTPTTEKAR